MRIPDYRNVHGVKNSNYWTPKANRVDKAHEDEFEKALEDSIHKRKSALKREGEKNRTFNKELVETQSEVDHLFVEYEQKGKWEANIDLDEETLHSKDRFSRWG